MARIAFASSARWVKAMASRAEEAVPFSEKPAAEAFVAEHGGRVLAFAEVPRDWALGDGGTAPGAPEPPVESPQHAH
jgi:copper chaperone NosL